MRFIMDAGEVIVMLVIAIAARCRPRSPRPVRVQNVWSTPGAWDGELGDYELGRLVC
jgi:hypothetical protein